MLSTRHPAALERLCTPTRGKGGATSWSWSVQRAPLAKYQRVPASSNLKRAKSVAAAVSGRACVGPLELLRALQEREHTETGWAAWQAAGWLSAVRSLCVCAAGCTDGPACRGLHCAHQLCAQLCVGDVGWPRVAGFGAVNCVQCHERGREDLQCMHRVKLEISASLGGGCGSCNFGAVGSHCKKYSEDKNSYSEDKNSCQAHHRQ